MANVFEAATMMSKTKENPNANLAFSRRGSGMMQGKAGSLLRRLNVKRLIVELDGQKVALPAEQMASVAMVTAELTHRLHRKGKALRCVGLLLNGEIEVRV